MLTFFTYWYFFIKIIQKKYKIYILDCNKLYILHKYLDI